MSRFANPAATKRLVLDGGCQCPGTPHEEDWMRLRTELGAAEVVRLAGGDSVAAMELLVVEWNLLDNDGQPAPLDREHFGGLYADNFSALDGWIEANVRVSALPNASAARSPKPSEASGSPTPTPKKAA